jgi:histidinol dehydrogenase
MIATIKYPTADMLTEILNRPLANNTDVQNSVATIVSDVKNSGDAAVKHYCKKFDKSLLNSFEVPKEKWEDAANRLEYPLKKAIDVAIKNISRFHSAQAEAVQPVETTEGVICWRRSLAVEKVGLYIPGGTAPLFSTLLMLAVPAKLAGCREIIVCTPPDVNGNIHSTILYAAHILGVDRIFSIGGAQAIAAMAYGTETVPKVYKIFGPGNSYVTAAKAMVSASGTAIDIPAGPSEVAVLADDSCIPAFVAADLLAQAEHGPDSQVLLVTDSPAVLNEVCVEVERQCSLLHRKDIAIEALRNSKFILAHSLSEGMDIINDYAPEHLIIATSNADELAGSVINAGSVFIGHYTPESAGDYASGTNHTLPTGGHARAYSGVSLDSFMKKITFQKISRHGLQNLADVVTTMAAAEGLEAHAASVTIRVKKINND